MPAFGTVEVNASDVYAKSFGALPNGTCYTGKYINHEQKGAMGDMRPALQKRFEIGVKAFESTSGGAGSTDKVMVPIYLDPVIVDISRKWTPLVELVPRVTNLGITADYNVITAKGAAAWLAEDSVLTEADSTRVRRSKPIKYLYAVGRVTGQAQAAVPSFMLMGFQPTGIGSPDINLADVSAPNARQLQILEATRSIKEKEEYTIINGSIALDANSYDGLIVQMTGINELDKTGNVIALNDLHTAVQKAFDAGGRPNLAVSNSRAYTDILKLLSTQITYREAARQVFWGFSALVLYSIVGEIPLIASMWMDNTEDKGQILFLDLTVIEMRVLQDLTYMELAKTNDSDKFFLKIYEVLIMRAPTFCSQIINIH